MSTVAVEKFEHVLDKSIFDTQINLVAMKIPSKLCTYVNLLI